MRNLNYFPKGFTLIEMMAVMVILGLLSSVVLPSFERWFTSTQDSTLIIKVSNRLQKLAIRAVLLEQDFELNQSSTRETLADGFPALDLPDGWFFESDEKLFIWKSGMCDPEEITFHNKKEKFIFSIQKENCNFSFKKKSPIIPK